MRRSLKRSTRKKRIQRHVGGNAKPSVAIYFSGRINGYEHVKDQLLALKNKYNATLFCSLNRSTKNKYIRTFQEIFHIDDDRMNIEKTPVPDWIYSCKMHPYATPDRFYSALYHNKRNFDMIEAYQNKNNIVFDIILFYRADITSHQTIDLIYPADKKTVYVPSLELNEKHPIEKISIPCINGMLAYGDFDSMKVYSYSVDSTQEICRKGLTLFHEIILYEHLKNNNIHIKDINFKHTKEFRLHELRHHSKPEYNSDQ